ncbi:UNVERIFIED_CONTAM: hypothetical protein PYX00_011735 [Menopon gallinae]|uniref:Uncharacterized protein n=1 Tax=Menopon gallinae TaxID=328185 RepID=A0AAW2H8C0_9NEOP
MYMRINDSLNVCKEPMPLCDSSLPLPRPVRIIDLSAEKSAIKEHDMDVFAVILGGVYRDSSIERFIEKLIDDPQVYDRKGKSCFFNVLLMAYFYLLKNDKRMAGRMRDVLKANVRFFPKTVLCFNFHFTGDEFVDSLVLSAQWLGDYYGESRFLNLCYKTHVSRESVSADMLAEFMRRLAESIEHVPREYVLDFLRNVFLHDTVIYHTIRAEQLVRIVFSFLKSRTQGKKEHHLIPAYRLSMSLLQTFSCSSLFSLLLDEVLRLPPGGKKSQSLRSWFEIKSDVSFEKYRAAIKNSCDSYESMLRIFDDISGCVYAIAGPCNMAPLLGFLDLLLLVFSTVSVEFLARLRVRLIKAISRVFLSMQNTVKDCHVLEADTVDNILLENKRLWPVLSKFVLAMHRMDAADSTKTSKKKNTRTSPTQSSLLVLIEKIKRFELLLTSKPGCEMLAERLTLLKNRSFEIRAIDIPADI